VAKEVVIYFNLTILQIYFMWLKLLAFTTIYCYPHVAEPPSLYSFYSI